MLLKTLVALALISELNFQIDMTALCSENCDQSDESPYLITSIFFNQLGFELASENAEE